MDITRNTPTDCSYYCHIGVFYYAGYLLKVLFNYRCGSVFCRVSMPAETRIDMCLDK
jgi:hypothetical protein